MQDQKRQRGVAGLAGVVGVLAVMIGGAAHGQAVKIELTPPQVASTSSTHFSTLPTANQAMC
jgi:hypothetical protein